MNSKLRITALFLSAALQGLAFDPRFQTTTAAELLGYGDFDGDGQTEGIVIDRETGAMRRLVLTGAGAPVWGAVTYAGIGKVDTFSVGPVLAPGNDQIALGGVFANRTHIVSPAGGIQPMAQLFSTGVGHRSLVAVDLALSGNDPARMDLIIATGWASEAGTQLTFQSTAGGVAQNGSEGPTPEAWWGHQRIKLQNGGADYVLFLGASSDPATVEAILADPGSPLGAALDVVGDIEAGSQFIHGPMLNSAANQIIFYVPGSPVIQICTSEPGTYLQAPVARSLAFAVGSLHLIHDGNGVGFLAIADDGTQAMTYRLNAAAVPVADASFFADADARLTGALALGSGQMTLLEASGSGLRSTMARHLAHDGSGWVEVGRGALPAIGARTGLANVLFFAGEPFVDATSAVTATVHIPDWTRDLTLNPDNSTTLIAETFGTKGLGAPRSETAGIAPATTTDAWSNQIIPQVSMVTNRAELGWVAPSLQIRPSGGLLSAWSVITVEPSDPAATVYVKLGRDGAWTSATGTQAIEPVGATLEDFSLYAFAEHNGVRSAIQQVDYQFDRRGGPLDSDGDSVPDYVELANGLSPTAGADSDADGVSDLRELLEGTDANDAASYVAALQPLAQQSVFNIAVRPLSLDTFSTMTPDRPSYAALNDPAAPAGTRVAAYAMDGALLGSAMTDFYAQDSFAGAAAWLPGIPAEPIGGFVMVATDASFPIRFDSAVLDASGLRADDRGVELLGCIPIPWLQLTPVPYTPAQGTDPLVAAAEWVTSASAHYTALSVFEHAQTLTYLDTLKLLLTERIFAQLLAGRDSTFAPDTFTLTPFRDTGAVSSPDVAQLMALEQPGPNGEPAYALHAVFAAVADAVDAAPFNAMQQLRELTRQLYLTAGTLGPSQPGLYPSVVDTLRAFLRGEALPGAPDSSYAAAVSLTAQQRAAAQQTVALLLGELVPRPIAVFRAEITANSFAEAVPVLTQVVGGQPLRLLQASGDAYTFPPGLQLLPGTEIEVQAFNDRSDGPFTPNVAVEALSVIVTALPRAQPADADRNGLEDSWELLFLGQVGFSPFGDEDGDAVSNLEELLRGTHPLRASSAPSQRQLPLRAPAVRVQRTAEGRIHLQVQFPAAFSEQVGFRLQTAQTLDGRFNELPISAAPDAENAFSLELDPLAGVTTEFFRFRLFLR